MGGYYHGNAGRVSHDVRDAFQNPFVPGVSV